ncbi:MAG: ABC transporter permease, partial [Actinocrinis sp.]
TFAAEAVTVRAQIKDAVTPRSALLVLATLGLGIGFILSYVGGLHHPTPRDLPFDIVAPAQIQAQTVSGLSRLPGHPLTPRLVTDAPTARARVADRTSTGALVLDPSGTTDTLYVASAAGPSISNALTTIIRSAEARQQRTVEVRDLVPVAAQDSGGLGSFYLAVGWTVAGYLIASILGVSAGQRSNRLGPATLARAVIRLIALGLCAIVAGIVGAWLVQHVLGAAPGPFWPLAGVGALVVFGAGAVTTALQTAFGVAGIGLAVLLFVILGNPSAGGAYARALLPPFWRAIGAFFPPGAGTDAARSISYFNGARTAEPLFILACYAVVGLLATLALVVVLRPRST